MKKRLLRLVAALSLLAGCGHAPASRDKLSVVTTTPILADLTRQVAGDRATVTSMVPSGADPHTYEPSLRDVRTVVYSRVALSNYLMRSSRPSTLPYLRDLSMSPWLRKPRGTAHK